MSNPVDLDHLTSADTTDNRSSHFIRQIIDADLASGKHAALQTRFPPEPNGYLHIGHAKAICLNFGLAQDYQGRCNLRFDDTNPEKESDEYVRAIQEDVKWLGFQWDGELRYSSSYFDQLHGYAIELINKGLAYVDSLTADEIREHRGTLTKPGINSPYRDRSIEENLSLFEQMKNGSLAEGSCCLRAKIDMASNFIVMRDPVIYRIRFVSHHQTGDKWCIYPMYDFAHCISDAIEGITHSLCTLEFQDNRRLYDWILDHITIAARPHQYEFSRLNLEYTVTSKRKLNQLVTTNTVSGWDDPRMPTISGLKRRGYTPASLREFCRRIGVTKQENFIEMSALENCIRDDLNEHAPRAMAVLDPIKLVIENYPDSKTETLQAPNHPDTPEMGEHHLPLSREVWIEREDFQEEANKKYKRLVLGKTVRLRHAYIVKATRCEKDAIGNITTVFCEYDPATLGKLPEDGVKPKGVIHWVDAKTAIPAQFNLYEPLFTVPNPAAEEDIMNVINPNSLLVKHGVAENSFDLVQSGTAYQLERTGYFYLDQKKDQLIFNRTVSLKDSFNK